jgi:hypothetical protein
MASNDVHATNTNSVHAIAVHAIAGSVDVES